MARLLANMTRVVLVIAALLLLTPFLIVFGLWIWIGHLLDKAGQRRYQERVR